MTNFAPRRIWPIAYSCMLLAVVSCTRKLDDGSHPTSESLETYDVSQVSCRDLKSTFFDHPTRVQEVEFAKYNLEQQYRLLLCGYQAMHPAELVPASEMARNAEKTGAFLADKLAKTRSDLTVLNIVFVFRLMQSMNTFEISSNNDLASLVRRRVDAIKDPDWQREATEMMREMGL